MRVLIGGGWAGGWVGEEEEGREGRRCGLVFAQRIGHWGIFFHLFESGFCIYPSPDWLSSIIIIQASGAFLSHFSLFFFPPITSRGNLGIILSICHRIHGNSFFYLFPLMVVMVMVYSLKVDNPRPCLPFYGGISPRASSSILSLRDPSINVTQHYIIKSPDSIENHFQAA